MTHQIAPQCAAVGLICLFPIAQGTNVNAKQFAALQNAMTAPANTLASLANEGREALGSAPSIGGAPASSNVPIHVFEEKAVIGDVQWQRVCKIIAILEKADSEGTKIYEKMKDMETTLKL